MERPNRIAKTMIGKKGRIGPVVETPMRLAPQPHWKTATVMPSAAKKLSRLVMAAVIGMTNERKSMKSAMKPRPITTKRKRGSTSTSTWVKSSLTACVPPT